MTIDDIRNKKIGKNVFKYRKRMGISQADVAERLDIPRASYTLIESGKRKLTATELFRLSHIFSVPMDKFFDGAY